MYLGYSNVQFGMWLNMHNDIPCASLIFYLSRRYRALLMFGSIWPRHKTTSKRPHGFGVSCETRYQTQSSPPGPRDLVLAKFAKRGALRRSPGGMPEVNSRNGDAPADTCLLSLRTGWNYCSPSHMRPRMGYACLCRHASERASERHYSAGGLGRVASRDNSVNCRSTPGTGWPAIY